MDCEVAGVFNPDDELFSSLNRGAVMGKLTRKLVRWLGLGQVFAIIFIFAPYLTGPVMAVTVMPAQTYMEPDQFLNAVESIAAEKLGKNYIDELRDSLAVIFIPGIAGSKLYKVLPDGAEKVIWGEGRPKARELALRYTGQDPDVKAKALDEYTIFRFKRADVYGAFENLLRRSRNARGLYKAFGYDWRLDINENAKLLDDYLRHTPELANKEIILIAHSMGGLVAWTWQQKFFQGAEDSLKVSQLITLGTPFAGSCEILQLLSKSYLPSAGASGFLKYVYGKIFSDLKPAAYTFPSVFQLLPKVPFDPDKACLTIPPERETSFDYFGFENWDTHPIGLALRQDSWKKMATSAGLPEGIYLNLVKSAIEKGEAFRNQLNLGRLNVPIVILYSRDHDTIHKVIGKAKDGKLTLEFKPASAGDGRVMQNSARNEDNLKSKPKSMVSYRRLLDDHGGLPADRRFQVYIEKHIRNRVTAAVLLQSARILLEHDDLFATYMEDRGGMVSVNKLIELLDYNPPENLLEPINRLNQIIRDELYKRGEDSFALKSYSENRQAQRDYGDNALQKDVILGMEFALKGDKPLGNFSYSPTFAYGRLGFELLKADQPVAAINNLLKAVKGSYDFPKKVAELPDVVVFQQTLLHNLGVAYFRTNQCKPAAHYLRLSEALNYSKSSDTLALECRDKETLERRPLQAFKGAISKTGAESEPGHE